MDMSYRILIVDDEETLCEVLKFNLEAEGYEVDTACNAEEVLAMDVSRYDLVLLDIMMGDISGIQLAKIIRLDPATSAIPIIFCTAKDSEDDMVKGLELGADDYITKPYSLRNILARVKTVLRRAKASANTRRLPDESVSFARCSGGGRSGGGCKRDPHPPENREIRKTHQIAVRLRLRIHELISQNLKNFEIFLK